MKKLLLLVLLLTSISSFAAEAPITVTDVNGATVDVDASEIRRAHSDLLKRVYPYADVYYTNSDGSVTIENPRVLYKNTEISVSYQNSTAYPNPTGTGFCALLGYTTYLFASTKSVTNGTSVASVNDKGSITSVTTAYYSNSVFADITCR